MDLCGPGAADVALWYWPNPNNNMNVASAHDPYSGGWTGNWNGTDVDGGWRMRGYLIQLGYNIHPSTYRVNGMMQGGSSSTDWVVRDGMNWEAAGHGSSWQSYFYAINYPNPTNGMSTLANDVLIDITDYHVPVVVLLNAGQLPNWPGSTVGHYITIIGYNDDNGSYAYTDTCGASTHCNSFGSDGGIWTVPQSQLYGAITSLPKYGGDWIW